MLKKLNLVNINYMFVLRILKAIMIMRNVVIHLKQEINIIQDGSYLTNIYNY